MSLSSKIALCIGLAGCGARAAPSPVGPPAAPSAPPIAPPDAAPADRDRDGITDDVDACPDEAMVMSAGCDAARQRGCPDDCRAPTVIAP